jgi:hypothetical protein
VSSWLRIANDIPIPPIIPAIVLTPFQIIIYVQYVASSAHQPKPLLADPLAILTACGELACPELVEGVEPFATID